MNENDIEQLKEVQIDVGKNIKLLRDEVKKLDEGKISEPEFKTFEEKLKEELKEQVDELKKDREAGMNAFEEVEKKIIALEKQSKGMGYDQQKEAAAKVAIHCMVNGIVDPLTKTDWGAIARQGKVRFENPLAGKNIPMDIPLEMQLKFLSDDEQKALFTSMYGDQKGSLLATDILPSSHLYMQHTIDRQIQKRLIETNPIYPYISEITISTDAYTYLEKTGKATSVAGLERSAPQKTEISDLKEHTISVHNQEIFVPFTQKAARKSTIINPEQFIIEEGTEEINRKFSYLHVIGNGIDAPEGLLSRDVGRGGEVPLIYTGNAAALFTNYSDFFDVITKLSQPYRQRTLRWFMNFNTMVEIWKYADENGRFYISEAQPFKLRGYEMVEMPGFPDVAAGSIPIVFGDLKGYMRVKSNFGYMIRDEVTDKKYVLIFMVREEGGGIKDPYSFVHVKVGEVPV